MAIISDPSNFVLFTGASLLCLSAFGSPKGHNARDSIIAKEKAALDRWKTGDTYGFIEIAADEITYFDPGLEERCTGIKEFRDRLSSINGSFSFPDYELLNPQVQLHGDIGILTFNFVGHLNDGKKSYWNATEVYCLTDDDWKIISSHWSHTKPQNQ
jgi:hypothetical protein